MNTITKIILLSLILGIAPHSHAESFNHFKKSLRKTEINRLKQIASHYKLMNLNPTHRIPGCDLCSHSDTGETCTTGQLEKRLKIVQGLIQARNHIRRS